MSSTRATLWVPIVAALALAGPVAAQEPRFDMAIVNDTKDSFDEKSTLAPDVPKIYVIYSLGDVPKGAKLRAAWIAEDVAGQPKNKIFDQVETAARGGAYMSAFSIVKPTGGFPPGAYRVELSIDGHMKKSVKFKIAKG